MELNRDFSEFIASCAAHDVRFLIVGGYAVAAHGHPRFTKDLDVWVWVDDQNANRLIAALEDFGFGSLGLTPSDFLEEGVVCWDHRAEIEVGGHRVPFISADDLIANKKASGRPQDLADVAARSAAARSCSRNTASCGTVRPQSRRPRIRAAHRWERPWP